MQLQNIVKLAKEANTQVAEIENTILQVSNDYRTQTAGDIFCISEDLQSIIQSNIENKAYHIQKLLANELDNWNENENEYMKGHIKEIQDIYKQENVILKDQDIKGKQQIQDEEVLLYKPYQVNLPRPKTPELIFI